MTDMREIAPWISRDLLKQIDPILPDGQIRHGLCFCLVQPWPKKYFCFSEIKSVVHPQPSRPTRGAYRDRHGRGAGCGGRESVRRATAVAGRDEPRERCAACKMIGALADGEAVSFWHPLLVLSWRRRNQARPG